MVILLCLNICGWCDLFDGFLKQLQVVVGRLWING